jgi:hypothetical protein
MNVVVQKYGIPLADLPAHCLDAVDAAERSRARCVVMRDAQPVAAIVPISDLDKIEPPDPAFGGVDPLLALCGTCRHDEFVDSLFIDMARTSLWSRG